MEQINHAEILYSSIRLYRCNVVLGLYPWIQHGVVTPYWRLYCNFLPGGSLRTIDGEMELLPGHFYLIPPHYHFDTFAKQPFDHFYIHFNLDDRLPRVDRIFQFEADAQELAMVRTCIEYGKNWETLQRRTLLCYVLTCALLLKLPPEILHPVRSPDWRIERIRELLSGDFRRNYSNDELAKRVHLARNSFLRLFQHEMGESPQHFRLRKRIEYAASQLFASEKSIEEIAEETGFSDRCHFSKTFARLMNHSPAAYRKAVDGQSVSSFKRRGSKVSPPI